MQLSHHPLIKDNKKNKENHNIVAKKTFCLQENSYLWFTYEGPSMKFYIEYGSNIDTLPKTNWTHPPNRGKVI